MTYYGFGNGNSVNSLIRFLLQALLCSNSCLGFLECSLGRPLAPLWAI